MIVLYPIHNHVIPTLGPNWRRVMERYKKFDISAASYEEFVSFLFDHEIASSLTAPKPKIEPWYRHAKVTCDPQRTLSFYTTLFSQPENLLLAFSQEQLEQGFWAAMSGTIACSVRALIWNQNIAFQERATCVRSMYHLYEKLFRINSLDTSANMWWDSLAYDWHCENRSRANGGEDEAMQDVMFETLERILCLPSEDCQFAALHGLGHLHHPYTQAAIDRFLNGSVSPKLKDYAAAARRFEVM